MTMSVPSPGPWTSHGHAIEGVTVAGPKPPDLKVARCMGPGGCPHCSREAAAAQRRVAKQETGMDALAASANEAEVGHCKHCLRRLIRTATDCWHEHSVPGGPCPPEVPGDIPGVVRPLFGDGFGRPGRDAWLPGPAPALAVVPEPTLDTVIERDPDAPPNALLMPAIMAAQVQALNEGKDMEAVIEAMQAAAEKVKAHALLARAALTQALPHELGPVGLRDRDGQLTGYGRQLVDHMLVAGAERTPVIDAAHLQRQREWSERTFGPGKRTKGVQDHITKEFVEILDDEAAGKPSGPEWIDVVILALDGAWRAGLTPEEILQGIHAKQDRNEARVWPDWRGRSEDEAIEHDRTREDS